jgi:Tfp pilus assembly ATPase PilU
VLGTLSERPRGLVLVTGPTGSGKSTTLAAMLDKINTERHDHILTIEDPIEYIHPHKNCLVNQREVHSDTSSFTMALRAALREDPDIVLIGEMRDLETVEAALKIAETTFFRPTSRRRSGRSCRWCSKASSVRRCCRRPTARAAWSRSRSWCRRQPSET